MFNISDQLFGSKQITIPPETQVIVISDMFSDEYVGGAELTTQALIDQSPLRCFKLKSGLLTRKLIEENMDKFFIFGNFSAVDPNLLPIISSVLNYSVLEYDYKYCKLRSPEKHALSNETCRCHSEVVGQTIAQFYACSKHIWWMSERQRSVYLGLFPHLRDVQQTVLSSVFSSKTIEKIRELRSITKKTSDKWVVCGSPSWVKGHETALKLCQERGFDSDVVWNISYDEMLKKFASSKGFVYQPNGGDTCPRQTIEAKLLGCELVLNENVQHKDEKWFAEGDTNSIEKYLSQAPETFWRGIERAMFITPKISGYVTTYNCISQTYPFERCIDSLLSFCSEVCVVDGGSTDGTWERLRVMSIDPRIVTKQVKRDWSDPRFAVFDGMQKAEARSMCVGDFCWQADCDEAFHEDDAKKVFNLCRATHADVIALPVIEYWGSTEKVRIDVTPWKWRLSRNKPHITHGIPRELRCFDENNRLYSAPGSDGCDLINATTFDRVPFVSFYTREADNCRIAALQGNAEALTQYEAWFNAMVNAMPVAFHYSWLDIERKIGLYKNYWQKHWNVLSNSNSDDTAENNMFFDVPWSEVTDEMVKARAVELAKTGGHIFHTKYTGHITPWIRCSRVEYK